MEIEERIKALQDEFRVEKQEIKQILLDIRTYLMEATTPLRGDSSLGDLVSKGDSRKEGNKHGTG